MQAIILFAHGSRDPLWHQPIQAVAQRIREKAPAVMVRCAYLELTPPDLTSTAHELVQNGAKNITIVPLFLGVGKHAREDLPLLLQDLQKNLPTIAIHCQPAVGEQKSLLDLLADIALSA